CRDPRPSRSASIAAGPSRGPVVPTCQVCTRTSPDENTAREAALAPWPPLSAQYDPTRLEFLTLVDLRHAWESAPSAQEEACNSRTRDDSKPCTDYWLSLSRNPRATLRPHPRRLGSP